MSWKKLWSDWGSVTVASVAFLGTFLLYERAWQSGNAGSAIGLLGCHVLRLPLLLLAWLAVSSEFKTAANKGDPPARQRFNVLDFGGTLFIFIGCIGLYPVWPFVLGLLTVPFVMAVILLRKEVKDPAEARQIRQALLSAGIAILLFTATWYFSASTTRQALQGLGERIEEKAGVEKLLDWAKDVIADAKTQKQDARFWVEELPRWVEELLGRNEGVRAAGIQNHGDEACVVLFTGSSGYHYRIDVCPSRANPGNPPWWAGEGNGMEWRPGILLNVEEK
jgi:hypothetical protein